MRLPTPKWLNNLPPGCYTAKEIAGLTGVSPTRVRQVMNAWRVHSTLTRHGHQAVQEYHWTEATRETYRQTIYNQMAPRLPKWLRELPNGFYRVDTIEQHTGLSRNTINEALKRLGIECKGRGERRCFQWQHLWIEEIGER